MNCLKYSLGLYLLLGLLFLIGASWGQARNESNHVSTVLSCAISADNELITIPVEILSNNCVFIFDTGSTPNVIDDTYKPSLGEPLKTLALTTPTGRSTIETHRGLPLRIGAESITEPVACIDLSPFRTLVDTNIYGILGLHFITNHAFRINFDTGLVEISRGASFPNTGYEVFRMAVGDNQLPAVSAKIGGQNIVFDLDTGANFEVALATEAFDVALAGGLVGLLPESMSYSVSGQMKKRRGLLKNLSIGPLTVTNLIITERISNTFGCGFLKRFNSILDFPQEKLHLKTREIPPPTPINFPGMVFGRKENRTVVLDVLTNSPCAQAGISPGDIIIGIGSHRTADRSLGFLRCFLATNTISPIPVTVERAGHLHKLYLNFRP